MMPDLTPYPWKGTNGMNQRACTRRVSQLAALCVLCSLSFAFAADGPMRLEEGHAFVLTPTEPVAIR